MSEVTAPRKNQLHTQTDTFPCICTQILAPWLYLGFRLVFLQTKGCLTTLNLKFSTIPEIPLHLHYHNKQELDKTEGRPAIHISNVLLISL